MRGRQEEQKMIYRFAAALAAVAASAAVLASGAFADQPARFPLGAGSFTISGVCSFDVQATLIANNEFETDFSDGSSIITGRLVYQYTNVTNGKSLVLNISGPGFISPDGQLVGRGTAEVSGFASPSGMFFIRGPIVFDFANSSFTTTSAATADLCAALS
jgi:hypothetical protein